MTGKEYLRRLQMQEAMAQRHNDLERQRRVDRLREERLYAKSWRGAAASFVVFGLVGVCIGVLTGVLFTEWLIRAWPDRLPVVRPNSPALGLPATAAGPPAAETSMSAPVAGTTVTAPHAATTATAQQTETAVTAPQAETAAIAPQAEKTVTGPLAGTVTAHPVAEQQAPGVDEIAPVGSQRKGKPVVGDAAPIPPAPISRAMKRSASSDETTGRARGWPRGGRALAGARGVWETRAARVHGETGGALAVASSVIPEGPSAEVLSPMQPQDPDRGLPWHSASPPSPVGAVVTTPVPERPAPSSNLDTPPPVAASVPVPAAIASPPDAAASASVPAPVSMAPAAAPVPTSDASNAALQAAPASPSPIEPSTAPIETSTASSPPVEPSGWEPRRSLTATLLDRLEQVTSLTPAEVDAVARVKAVLGRLPEVRLGKQLIAWARRVTARPTAQELEAAPQE
jgi:hypothetical protein